jgi:hypothetical protein
MSHLKTGLCSLFGACFPRFLFYLILFDYCAKNRSFGDMVVVYVMGLFTAVVHVELLYEIHVFLLL